MFAVVVTFSIKSGCLAQFMPLMLQNAETSLRTEPGCHQFDVATDPARADEVFLYEIYENKAAFEAHLASPQFKKFHAASAPMIAGKSAKTYQQVYQ